MGCGLAWSRGPAPAHVVRFLRAAAATAAARSGPVRCGKTVRLGARWPVVAIASRCPVGCGSALSRTRVHVTSGVVMLRARDRHRSQINLTYSSCRMWCDDATTVSIRHALNYKTRKSTIFTSSNHFTIFNIVSS